MEGVCNFLQKPTVYNITHLAFGMLLHYLGKLKTQILCRYSADMAEMQKKCILIASNFVINPQILNFFQCLKSRVFPHKDCK